MRKIFKSEWWQNLKEKFKNYGFWLSLTSSIVIFLQTIGIGIDDVVAEQVVGAFCSVLVMLGIISNPNSGKGYIDKCDKLDDTQKDSTQVCDNVNNTQIDSGYTYAMVEDKTDYANANNKTDNNDTTDNDNAIDINNQW